jgi:hypothetical protein
MRDAVVVFQHMVSAAGPGRAQMWPLGESQAAPKALRQG